MTANIFDDIPHNMPKEVVQTLLQADDVRIERIISYGHASAADFWYDQPQHEWVIVLKGAATLQFEDKDVGPTLRECFHSLGSDCPEASR